jgi:hypothetical protein
VASDVVVQANLKQQGIEAVIWQAVEANHDFITGAMEIHRIAIPRPLDLRLLRRTLEKLSQRPLGLLLDLDLQGFEQLKTLLALMP